MILAVVGGKGGVGVSTVAYNLAAELDAVLIDTDLTMPDLPRPAGPALHDVLAGRVDPREAIRTGGPVDLLPAARSLVAARAADPTALAEVARTLAASAEIAVLDCPTGPCPGAGLGLQAADAALIVSTPTPVAVADGRRLRTLARRLDAGRVSVVLNRTPPDHDVAAVERVLGGPVVTVPASLPLGETVERDQPVRAIDPRSQATAQFAALGQRVQRSRRS